MIRSRNAASFNRRMADAVPKPEWFCLCRQSVTILTPYRRYPRQRTVRLPRGFEYSLKAFAVWRHGDQHDVNFRRPERLFPIVRAALASISEFVSARGHSLPEFPGEAVE